LYSTNLDPHSSKLYIFPSIYDPCRSYKPGRYLLYHRQEPRPAAITGQNTIDSTHHHLL